MNIHKRTNRQAFAVFMVLVLILWTAAPIAMAQTGQKVAGCIPAATTETCHALAVDASGNLTLGNSAAGTAIAVTTNSTYKTAVVSGSIALPVGSTVTVLSAATYTSALTVWQKTGADITINVMDGSGRYIFGPNYVLPSGQIQGFPLGAGLLFTGVGGSASATGVTISAGGDQ